jgi:hypothetical protein
VRKHDACGVGERETVGIRAHADGARDGERRSAALVGGGDARRRAGCDLRDAGLQQHSHLRQRRRPERRALVVVGQDLLMRPALQGRALGAVLAHAHAVAVAVAGEREGGVRGRHGRHRERGDECEHEMGAAQIHDEGLPRAARARPSD